MDVFLSGTIDQKTYLKKFRGASDPLVPLDPPMETPTFQGAKVSFKIQVGFKVHLVPSYV